MSYDVGTLRAASCFVLCCLPDDKCKDTTSEMRCQVFYDVFSKHFEAWDET